VIVVGSRGLGPIKRAMVGSTSHEILAHAERRVLVVPKQVAPEPAPVTSE
jgi:nucleotide-binding universal stress UspA family protein